MTKPYLTRLDVEGWEIDDGELAHAASPDTCPMPPLARRQALVSGTIAELRFYIRTEDEDGQAVDNAERMWVEVLGRVDDWYRGVLGNQPSCTDEIEPGMEVWFQPRHVIDITETPPDEAANDPD